jgi:hypothetical protein
MRRSAILTAIWVAIVFISVSGMTVSAYHSRSSGAWHYPGSSGQYDYYGSHSSGFHSYGAIDFRAALSPYGTWQYLPELGGHVWIPYVPAGWRPYSYGAWTYTTFGWTWVSYEPWGWIPHHYGNWIFHPVYQWIWIPGYSWAPARVVWGFFNGYYGWAPLPPQHTAFYSYHGGYSRNRSYHWYSRYSSGGGHQSGHSGRGYPHGRSSGHHAGNEYYEWIPNDAWVIVSSSQFMNDNISEVAVGPENNVQIMSNRSFSFQSDAPVKTAVERDIRRQIPETPVDEVRKTVDGNEIRVVRPQKIEPSRSQKMNSIQQKFRPKDLERYQRSDTAIQREPKPQVSRPQPQQRHRQQTVPQQRVQPRQQTPPQSYQPPTRHTVQPRQQMSPQRNTPPPRIQPEQNHQKNQQQTTPPSNRRQTHQPNANRRQVRPPARHIQPTESNPEDDDKDEKEQSAGLSNN